MTVFPRLFTPATLRSKRLRNRIVFGAHTANMANDDEHRALADMRITARLSGDAAAPRLAPYAIHEGRKAALSIP